MITDILFGLSEYGLRQARIAIIRQARRDRVLRREYIRAVQNFRKDMDSLLRDAEYREINPHSDLFSDVYDKDIATSDKDLLF